MKLINIQSILQISTFFKLRGNKKMKNQEPEKVGDILRSLDLFPAPWIETRGRKRKYFFHHMKPGQVDKIKCFMKKARAIQTAIKKAANEQGFKIMTQNRGNYIAVKRIK